MHVANDPRNYTAPWAEQLPDGQRIEYGPSPSAYARQVVAHKLWTWRPGRQPSHEARSEVGEIEDVVEVAA